MKKTIGTLSLLMLFFAHGAYAGFALDTVENGVNKVLEVAGDPALAGQSGKSQKIEKIKKIIDDFFDYTILSRLTLGKNWKKLTSDQQKEFIVLYRALLEQVYMDRILAYSDEKVEFLKESKISEKKSEVQTRIVTPTTQIPIYYRLYFRNEQWKVYDVIIEGVSLVKSYRGQFNTILTNKSPGELIQILRDKTQNA